jgi:hypothetical protein
MRTGNADWQCRSLTRPGKQDSNQRKCYCVASIVANMIPTFLFDTQYSANFLLVQSPWCLSGNLQYHGSMHSLLGASTFKADSVISSLS